jgi:hypothetical protein
MPRLQDITCDPEWLSQQTDRLLGFEVLYKGLTGYANNIQPSTICEKIGVHPTFTRGAVLSFVTKFSQFNYIPNE